MKPLQDGWQDCYRQGMMYEWWRQQNQAQVWQPLAQVDRRLSSLVEATVHMKRNPLPPGVEALVSEAIDACGRNMGAVQHYVEEHAPKGVAMPEPLLHEAYQRETMRRRLGWAWKEVVAG